MWLVFNVRRKQTKMLRCLLKALRESGWAPFLVFIFYVVAAKVFDAYLRFPNLDMPTHFLGGAAITYFYFTSLRELQHVLGRIPISILAIAAFGLTAVTAVVWEFLEYGSDLIFGTKMNLGVPDTLSDLFFGLFGGFVVASVSWMRSKKSA